MTACSVDYPEYDVALKFLNVINVIFIALSTNSGWRQKLRDRDQRSNLPEQIKLKLSAWSMFGKSAIVLIIDFTHFFQQKCQKSIVSSFSVLKICCSSLSYVK